MEKPCHKKTLMIRLLDAGCHRREMRESNGDLIVVANEVTAPIVNAYYVGIGWNREKYAPIVHNPSTGTMEYCCKDEWDVFWECGDILYGDKPYTMDS